MFAIAAVVSFAVAALLALTPLSGLSVIGLLAVGLACLALDLALRGWAPWHRE